MISIMPLTPTKTIAMTWFETLTGFSEHSPQQVRENLTIDGQVLISKINGKRFSYGQLEIPSLAELRERVQASRYPEGKLSVREVVADVQQLHTDPANTHALFQVASQFNLLEMVSPNVTPEEGIGIYDQDRTQGPACAIAAGAGTIYRNYFVPIQTQIGQSADLQIDCLADLGNALGNVNDRLWQMQNGYVITTESSLVAITQQLQRMNDRERDTLRQLLRIGIQWDTQVTLKDNQHQDCHHLVSQVYCSALPIAYSQHPIQYWTDFSQLILEASYEATLHTAILNFAKTGCRKVFLTLVGGGAFGNQTDWIIAAMQRSLTLVSQVDLEVSIVSYGRSNPEVKALIQQF